MGNNQSQRIASAVKEYVQNHIEREFTAKELRFFVLSRVNTSAPGSADRIMRQLRQAGIINYVLVSRSKSLYRGVRAGQVRAVDISGGTLGAGTDPDYKFGVTSGRTPSDRPNGCGGEVA